LFCAGLNGCGVKMDAQQQDQKPTSLRNIIHEGSLMVDVRTVSEYNSGHVKGSINVPLSIVSGKIEQFRVERRIVVFCQSGSRSSKAKNILENYSIKNVINGGGWEAINALLNEKY